MSDCGLAIDPIRTRRSSPARSPPRALQVHDPDTKSWKHERGDCRRQELILELAAWITEFDCRWVGFEIVHKDPVAKTHAIEIGIRRTKPTGNLDGPS